MCEIVVDSAELGRCCAAGECADDFACAHVVDLDLEGVCVHGFILSHDARASQAFMPDPVPTRVSARRGWIRSKKPKILIGWLV